MYSLSGERLAVMHAIELSARKGRRYSWFPDVVVNPGASLSLIKTQLFAKANSEALTTAAFGFAPYGVANNST